MGEGDGGKRMKTRKSALCALGLAAALTLGGAVTASAQVTDTTGRARSQTRIPIRKDQPAPPPRVDTVTVTRTDTIRITRTDTVTVQRTDTVTRIEEIPLQPLKSWEFGIGVGMDIPTGAWLNVAKLGPIVQAYAAWYPGKSPLGIRLEGDYSNYSKRETDCPACSSTQSWALGGDLVLRVPLDQKSKVRPTVYFLGGGGATWFTDFNPYLSGEPGNRKIVTAGNKTFTAYPGLGVVTISDDSNTLWHWDVGGGIALGNFYVESKYVSVQTNGNASAHVPVVFGVRF
jgi:hypothetical protein